MTSKSRPPAASKPPKLSFSVDRSEFDISSEWVQAVMRPPSLPGPKAPFFSPANNNATDASSATGEQSAAVAESPTGESITPVAENPTAAEIASVAEVVGLAESATVTSPEGFRENAPVALLTPVEDQPPTIAPLAESANAEAVAQSATVAGTLRPYKLRPLQRITDGLTPGQYAVYSLMFANSEEGQGGARLYRGGYADLGRLTGLSKRGIQNVIGELQKKAVIQLHTPPGHRRSETSAYVVPPGESVVAAWRARGWCFAVGKSKTLTNGAPVALFSTGDAA